MSVRTTDLLASRPEIDADRIGITGISLGGIVAATAAGNEPRLQRAVFILSGGDLLPLINHAKETRSLSGHAQNTVTGKRGSPLRRAWPTQIR